MIRVFCSLILFACCSGCAGPQEPRAVFEKEVAGINAKCPVLLDSETQFDGVDLAGDTLYYRFTLINALAKATDTSQFRVAMWPGILSTVKVSDEMKPVREQDLFIRYSYKDKYGTSIYNFLITPAHYSKMSDGAGN